MANWNKSWICDLNNESMSWGVKDLIWEFVWPALAAFWWASCVSNLQIQKTLPANYHRHNLSQVLQLAAVIIFSAVWSWLHLQIQKTRHVIHHILILSFWYSVQWYSTLLGFHNSSIVLRTILNSHFVLFPGVSIWHFGIFFVEKSPPALHPGLLAHNWHEWREEVKENIYTGALTISLTLSVENKSTLYNYKYKYTTQIWMYMYQICQAHNCVHIGLSLFTNIAEVVLPVILCPSCSIRRRGHEPSFGAPLPYP